MLFTEVPSGAHCPTGAQAASVTVAALPHHVGGGRGFSTTFPGSTRRIWKIIFMFIRVILADSCQGSSVHSQCLGTWARREPVGRMGPGSDARRVAPVLEQEHRNPGQLCPCLQLCG